jgi:hypothetical protein
MRLRRITARRSSVHGKGLFALLAIGAGERLIEYKGEVTSWRRAAARQRSEVGHTFVFGLSSGRVIDGSRGGNSARFMNHACTPNCEAIETGDRVFIHAITAIQPGEERSGANARPARWSRRLRSAKAKKGRSRPVHWRGRRAATAAAPGAGCARSTARGSCRASSRRRTGRRWRAVLSR